MCKATTESDITIAAIAYYDARQALEVIDTKSDRTPGQHAALFDEILNAEADLLDKVRAYRGTHRSTKISRNQIVMQFSVS